MPPTIDDLFASPDHYLHSFERGAAVFVPMDRASYRRSIFLDHRMAAAAAGSHSIPVADLIGRAGRPAATGWIFHIAHCGSTLLARALGEMSDNLVLREPLALRQAALAPDEAALRPLLTMLGKRYAAGRPTVIKANVPVNFILERIAAVDSEARAILLYCGLCDYLSAILRSDQHRAWVRGITELLEPKIGDLAGAADAQRAAALSIAQMRRFADALAAMPNARTLDCEVFFGQPRRVLPLAAAHLEIPATAHEVDALVAGSLFSTYSKNPGLAFDNAARLARKKGLQMSLALELEVATRWVERNAPDWEVLSGTISDAALDVDG